MEILGIPRRTQEKRRKTRNERPPARCSHRRRGFSRGQANHENHAECHQNRAQHCALRAPRTTGDPGPRPVAESTVMVTHGKVWVLISAGVEPDRAPHGSAETARAISPPGLYHLFTFPFRGRSGGRRRNFSWGRRSEKVNSRLGSSSSTRYTRPTERNFETS